MEGKNKVRLGLGVIAAIIMVAMLFSIDYASAGLKDFLGPFAMVLLIMAMILSIRYGNK